MNIKDYIKLSIDTKTKILNDVNLCRMISETADIICQAYQNNNKVLTAGNGGSAGDAQHIAGELVSRFFFNRPALGAISLSTDTSVLTSIGNDYGFENIFERQIEANANRGDVFIAISTSGNSKNIVKAIKRAKEIGVITVGLTGIKPSCVDNICDFIIKVPSDITPVIQESHIMIGQIICACVEEKLFKQGEKQ